MWPPRRAGTAIIASLLLASCGGRTQLWVPSPSAREGGTSADAESLPCNWIADAEPNALTTDPAGASLTFAASNATLNVIAWYSNGTGVTGPQQVQPIGPLGEITGGAAVFSSSGYFVPIVSLAINGDHPAACTATTAGPSRLARLGADGRPLPERPIDEQISCESLHQESTGYSSIRTPGGGGSASEISLMLFDGSSAAQTVRLAGLGPSVSVSSRRANLQDGAFLLAWAVVDQGFQVHMNAERFGRDGASQSLPHPILRDDAPWSGGGLPDFAIVATASGALAAWQPRSSVGASSNTIEALSLDADGASTGSPVILHGGTTALNPARPALAFSHGDVLMAYAERDGAGQNHLKVVVLDPATASPRSPAVPLIDLAAVDHIALIPTRDAVIVVFDGQLAGSTAPFEVHSIALQCER